MYVLLFSMRSYSYSNPIVYHDTPEMPVWKWHQGVLVKHPNVSLEVLDIVIARRVYILS